MIPRRTPLKRSTKPIPKRRAKPRRGPLRDKGYLQFLRDEGVCYACKIRRMYFALMGLIRPMIREVEPAHGPVNGIGSKGPDNEAIPLCRQHHLEQHKLGWPAFQKSYYLDRAKEAAVWYKAYQIYKETLT